MKDILSDWTKDELKAYVLLYCANADFIEKKEERKLIISKVGKDVYEKVHKEIEKDNDFQSLQKIMHALEFHGYTHEQIDLLLNEIMDVFMCDGCYDEMEKNCYRGLKRLLETQSKS